MTLDPGEIGLGLVEAIAAKDHDRVMELLDPDLSFRALTPNRFWETSTAAEFVAEVLPAWFEDSDHVEEVLEAETGEFADREHIAYSFRGHNDDGAFVVEQHAYYTVSGDRIDWLRVLCSGFRPPGE